ncbi:methyltransferase domain-containing protein [Moraxella sp. Tifton1]|uniref:methyltransferase domain-containing protein n=1 Tax=Moraxella oculi TaxID=2940516 RepID=UPI0020117791|nr:methyltransferase domain-containing protein [Moraxella sp. Tifton1]MCL1624228.1 methyltransferase domain-containing protein [Moraxella sp. Tifton1]
MNVVRIARRFSAAYDTYQNNAIAQKVAAKRLMSALVGLRPPTQTHFAQVLEIGCGSGGLTEQLLQYYVPDLLYLNDLYDKITQNRLLIPADAYRFLLGDIGKISLPTGLDLVLSGSVLQWIYPLDELFAKIHQSLAMGGVLAFSTFGKNNLWQLKRLTNRGLVYYSLDEIVERLIQSGFCMEYHAVYQQTLHFDNAMAVLRHLQATGVTATDSDFHWSKESLSRFCQAYQSYADDEGLPLTYEPMILIAKKL